MIIGNTACPSCVAKGRDRTGNHLMLFEDGGSYCNRCGYGEGKGTFTEVNVKFSKEWSDEEVAAAIQGVQENSTIQSLQGREIKAHVCKHYGVRVAVSETDGQTQTERYYPIPHIETGDVQGYKVKTNSTDKRTYAKGRLKSGAFFGSTVIPKKGKKIFITEGEDDCLALYQAIYENCDTSWRNRISVVSLINGASGADQEMMRNRDLLDAYKEIILCFDMDSAGEEGVAKACKVLNRAKVFRAQYEHNDANDMVKEGLSKELYFNAIMAGKPRPEKIITGAQITLAELRIPLKAGIQSIYQGLNRKLHGFRYGDGGGELSVWCAGSGMGKTTAAREIMYDFNANHGLRLGNVFLEEQYRKTAQSYIAIDNNVPVAALRENPDILNDQQWELSHKKLVNNGRISFLKHFGSLASDSLMDYFWYLSAEEKCDFIMLDHISMVVSGETSGAGGERKDIDILMTKLAAFCEDSGTSVQAVVHLKRPPDGSFNDGKRISLSHLRGSAAIEQLSHNIFAIEGDQHGDNPNTRIIRVLKNREWGDLGEADTVEYNPTTGRLMPVQVSMGGNKF